ncbi:hypothetical protein [Tropicibacter sp. S64]|uniref:hypothetical protein n=1 Tax=Tropicibacter sp. S64 TaxID=3415122 RepID=UPI003C7A2977
MKHGKLHSVAHNYAASLSGGLSFVVPHQVIHSAVYAEAAATADGFIVVDFLSGRVTGACDGSELENIIPLFRAAFPAFCARHGVDHAAYRSCLVRFVAGPGGNICVAGPGGNSYVITVEDRCGVRTAREYLAAQGRRSMEMDALGRMRPKKLPSPEA